MTAECSSTCEDVAADELMEEIENEPESNAASSVSVMKANERPSDAKKQSEDITGVTGNNDGDDANEEQDSDADDNQFVDAMESDGEEEPRVTGKREDAIAREPATIGKPVAGPNPQLEAENRDVVDASRQVSTNSAEPSSVVAADRTTTTSQAAASVKAAPAVVTRKEWTEEEKKPARVVAVEHDATSLRPTVQSTPSSSNKPFVPLAPPKNWRTMALRSNGKINRIVQAALLKTLLHAIRRGSVEGVRVAIERGVVTQYIDSRGRNLVMQVDAGDFANFADMDLHWSNWYAACGLIRLAAKCDTDARLQIAIILSDAGCDINHKDQLGWSCLHYACNFFLACSASGALDVAAELIRRGARVEYNPYGYGPEDFIIPKVARAKSLLQHTEQLQHEASVKSCWDFFRKHAKKTGYSVKCRSHCDLGKPLKISFEAPPGHSSLDRIRVIDMNSEVPLWLQVSKNFSIPPGDVGSITIDSETLDRPSLYRIFYEKYEPTPIKLPAEVAENNFSIKNLDTGTTVSVGSVNELVLRELSSTRNAKKSKGLSNSSREAPATQKSTMPRRVSTTRFRELAETERESGEEAEEAEFAAEETVTMTEIAEHPAVTSITGVYKIVGMAIVSVSTLKRVKANEYEIVIKSSGTMGLHLEPKRDKSNRSTKLIVRRSSGQTAAVNPGDCLVAIGRANIEHAGLKHTLWELNASKRPLVLRFRRGNVKEKKSLFTSIRNLSGPKPQAAIAV
ncbi:hypothetical protein FI667_g1223, partial [Globisporangium splendens]